MRFRWAARTQRRSKINPNVHKITETTFCPGKGRSHASFRQKDALVFLVVYRNEIRLHRLYHSNWRPSWRPRSTRPRSSHSGPLRRVVDHPTHECKSIDDEDKVSKNSDREGAERHVRAPSSVADKISSLVLRGQGVFARASLAQRSPRVPTF